MLKIFILGFIAGTILLAVSGVAGFQPQQAGIEQKRKEQQELALYKAEVVDATPVQLGILTERQKNHSKLYSFYREQNKKKISDLLAHAESKVIGIVFHVGVGEVLPKETPENYFKKLADQSDAIIRGRIIKKVSQVTEDDTFIFTDYDVSVIEVLKNNVISSLENGSSIIVTRPGGKIVVNDVVMYIKDHSYLPLPNNNNEVVLFLKYIPETGAYQTAQDTGSFELSEAELKPLTKVYFPQGVLTDSDSFLKIIRNLSAK
jgi:hypothetical protein